MHTFIALLRGVNVGKANRVPMLELKRLLQDLGYKEVSTLLNSGNAVFRSKKGTSSSHALAISEALTEGLNVAVPVIVKSEKELAAILADCPFATQSIDHSQLLVAVTQHLKDLEPLAAVMPLVIKPETYAIGRNAAYLNCANGIRDSKAAAALLGKMGRTATTRNWATLLKLKALATKQQP